MLVLFIIALAGAGVFYLLAPSAAKQDVVIHGSTEREHIQQLHEGTAFTKSQV
ncbi:hypothetical protein [Paenibacillus albus]|uniref:hypothetical protein n=1 Tax=Paenibacillus albus TaxID=2495582 RepID=UPI0013DEA3D7|nr:hypothetical protein [Paenibacillus albus]